jgi:hypothetical protein
MYAEKPMFVAALGPPSIPDSPDTPNWPNLIRTTHGTAYGPFHQGSKLPSHLNRAEILPRRASDISSPVPPLLHLILITETLVIIAISARQPL